MHRQRLVTDDLGAIVALPLTAIGVGAIGARAEGTGLIGWITVAICAIGITLIDPRRARPITIPALRLVGAITLAIVAASGAWTLLDNAASIV